MAKVSPAAGWRLLCLLAMLLAAGCSHEAQESPEEQIRALLDAAEVAVESRSLEQSAELISSGYSDEAGRDRQALKRLLMGYFLRNKTIHVLKQVQSISLESDAAARVVLFAGVAGNQPDRGDTLAQWRGDLIRLQLELVIINDAWRLNSASWRRATQGDLL